ncbi:membrane lipoprotein lipid attachment site-containing protein [Psychrobacillus sp. FSL H8-0484]|uniref:membrane lipoprotein lipid attachment site-containing protein n=1 Tax=Psychrobacillus sp. FSL H8-0484 TaxID=2921390 RepID=UPI0030F8BC6C
MKKCISFLLIIFLLSGCNTEIPIVKEQVPSEKGNITETISENEQFILTVRTEKEEYQVGEPLEITATLAYKGETDTVTVAHSGTPILFETTNLTKDYQFGWAMNTPLYIEDFKKNEPYKTVYSFSGGSYHEGMPGEPYSDDEYREVAKGNLSPGKYEIKAMTKLSVGENPTLNKVELEANIIFTVVE